MFGIVVPCFDEAGRLRTDALVELANDPAVHLVLVDDGSTDGTAALLESIAARAPGTEVLHLPRNVGKGEAVRAGLRRVLERDLDWAGYVDADLATPVGEVLRLLDVATSDAGRAVVLGSRVALLGRHIRRSAIRHGTGRVFATAAARVLDVRVYDTQCGAKLLRVGPPLAAAVAQPFRSRWAFDVELLGRLLRAGTPVEALWEEPLADWRDAPGSKRSITSSVRATAELVAIRRDLRRWPPGPAGTMVAR